MSKLIGRVPALESVDLVATEGDLQGDEDVGGLDGMDYELEDAGCCSFGARLYISSASTRRDFQLASMFCASL